MTRSRLGSLAAVCVLLAALLTALAGTHVTPPSITAQSREAAPLDGGRATFRRSNPREAPASGSARRAPVGKGINVFGVLLTVAAAVFALGALYGLGILLVVMLRNLLSPRGRYAKRRAARRADPPPVVVSPAVARAVDAGIAGLEDDPAGSADAIIAAWLGLRAAVTDTGLAPHPADTPDDLVRRVLGRWAVRPDALGALADLYREARFSEHALGPAERAAALAALQDIRADLLRGPSGSGAGPARATSVRA